MAAVYFVRPGANVGGLTFHRLVDFERLERQTDGCPAIFLAPNREMFNLLHPDLPDASDAIGEVVVQIKPNEVRGRFTRPGFWWFDTLSALQYERRMRLEAVPERDPLWTRAERAASAV